MISSRTPEGEPNVCAVCGNEVKVEPSMDTRDGPCPCCGHLLWFGEEGSRGPGPGRMSYESLLIRVGKSRHGEFPAELQGRLIAAIGTVSAMSKEKDLTSIGLVRLVVEARDWEDVLARLERGAEAEEPVRRSRPVGRSVVGTIVSGIKKLLVGSG